MNVHLDESLFEAPTDDIFLFTLFGYALRGRHRVGVETGSATFTNWFQLQGQIAKEQVNLAIDSSVRAEAIEPARVRVIVGKFEYSRMDVHPLQVSAADAHMFLETPILILLEDSVSDRAFLLRMLTLEERALFERRESDGFVRCEHGGGLTRMAATMREKVRQPASRHTMWILFDSDGLCPGVASRQANELADACGSVPYYRLQRRFSENYLTIESLNAWAQAGNNRDERRDRFGKLQAFQDFRPEQRHHFNMKLGFDGDSQRDDRDEVGTLFDDVGADVRASLRGGFGGQIKALFQTPNVTEAALRREGGWDELRTPINVLLSLLR